MSSAIALETGLPRLAPIERPPTLLVRLLAWVFRYKLGKVMTPLKVVYNRMPRMVFPQLMMLNVVERGLALDPHLVALVQTRVSMTNGCSFCADLHEAYAARQGHARGQFSQLDRFADSNLFDARERAALQFCVEAALGHVADTTFASLRAHFDERAIVELTWLCAFTTYLNRLAVPLGIGSDGFCALLPEAK